MMKLVTVKTLKDLWKVESQAVPGKYYSVVEKDDGILCTCKDYEMGNVCKHCFAVLLMEVVA